MATCNAKTSGFTLLESLVAAAVMLVFFVTVSQILLPCLQLTVDNARRTGLQQQSRSILDRFELDVRKSAAHAISLQLATAASDPAVFAMNRVSDATFSGQVQFEPQLVVYAYVPATRSFLRKLYPPGPPAVTVSFSPSQPTVLAGADLLSLVNSTNGTETYLARNLTGFSLAAGTAGAYTIALQLSESLSSTRTESYQLIRTVYPRN